MAESILSISYLIVELVVFMLFFWNDWCFLVVYWRVLESNYIFVLSVVLFVASLQETLAHFRSGGLQGCADFFGVLSTKWVGVQRGVFSRCLI
jgi:hypothetical protein